MTRTLTFGWFSALLLTVAAFALEDVRTFSNPVIAGFYPDPSICRVGDDYYTVHSTFEYFPGVPIFHSRDLVNWKQIGYCLSRSSQLKLDNVPSSGGIYAPTLRYHDGTFYMVTTNVYGGGNFYVIAKDPKGPWSDPVWLDQDGIDPSLFFDDDGTVYYTRHEGMGDGHVAQCTLNLKTGRLEGELRKLWDGTGGVWPEGPHLYKIRGRYYLMIAEGGTSFDHMVTIARSDSPWGPFESNPANPILTHRGLKEHPFQALGHADFVETPDGWWMVFLAIRPNPETRVHHIGRETFLAPVTWNDDGWPVVNGGKPVEATMRAPNLPEYRFEEPAARDDFDSAQFGLQWNFIRNPHEENYSLTERAGHLRLKGSALSLSEQGSPTFAGRRQTDLSCKVSAAIDFNPSRDNEEAGLAIRSNEKNHYIFGITRHEGRRKVFVRTVIQGDAKTVESLDAPDGKLVLCIEANMSNYTFSWRTTGSKAANSVFSAPTADLSSERAGGFTGVYIGMYASGNGQSNSESADFDWYEYSRD